MPNWYLIEMLQYTDVVLDNKVNCFKTYHHVLGI